MRYLPMILGAGLLLSVGLLAGSGPAHAAMPTLALDRSAVADTAVEKVAYYHRYARRHYRRNYYGYRLPSAILRLWLPTALLWLLMAMGVAGAIETRRNTNLSSWVQSKPVATSARSLSVTGSARWLRGSRPAFDSAGRISLYHAKSRQPFCISQ